MLVRCLALTYANPKLTKRDRWVCRDSAGLLHNAMVARFFDTEGELYTLQVSTACQPAVRQINLAPGSGHVGQHLPQVLLERFILVEYNVREVPTCLQCWARSSTVFE